MPSVGGGGEGAQRMKSRSKLADCYPGCKSSKLSPVSAEELGDGFKHKGEVGATNTSHRFVERLHNCITLRCCAASAAMRYRECIL